MATEAEKKQHRCCFVGHRPEKLSMPPAEVKEWLRKQISQAVADGYVTFITGMSMGVDIWAGQIVAELKRSDPRIHLIAAVPWPGFSARWHDDWKAEYQELLKQADLVKNVRSAYSDDVFKVRNEWMVDHCECQRKSEPSANQYLSHLCERILEPPTPKVTANGEHPSRIGLR